MGDYADDAVNEAITMEGLRQDYRFGEYSVEEAYELGILDDHGMETTHPMYQRKPSGPGNCPNCGGPTKLVTGRFGQFYGCCKFPKCKGSRNC